MLSENENNSSSSSARGSGRLDATVIGGGPATSSKPSSSASSITGNALGGGPASSSKPTSRTGSLVGNVEATSRRPTAASLLMAAVAIQAEVAQVEEEEEFVPYETPPTFPLDPVGYLHNRASELSGVPHRRLTEVDESDLGVEMGDFHLHRLADSFDGRDDRK